VTADHHGPLRRFIRGVLGCGCPDEVLRHIRVAAAPPGLDDLPLHRTVNVGGRLLVVVVREPDPGELAERLDELIPRLVGLRDAEGFNRVRLVVTAAHAGGTETVLTEAFAAVAGSDDRVHLHVITPARLPPLTVDACRP
jgi:hypothetical protein